MTDSNEKDKRYVTEWSFSFEDLGDKLGEFVRGLGGEQVIQKAVLNEPLADATAAEVHLFIPVAETTIHSAPASTLFSAELTYIGELEYTVTGEGRKQISLGQKTAAADWMKHMFAWVGTQNHLRWDIGLAQGIPVDLRVHAGVGKATIDLTNVSLSALSVEGGTGSLELTVPASTERLPVRLNGGVGEYTVTLADNANTDLRVTTGTGQATVKIGQGSDVSATIQGGVGQTDIHIPQGAAVRIKAQMGLGDISAPARFVRTKGESGFGPVAKVGVWETAGYDTAERRITITFQGGVGGLTIREQ